MGAHIVRGAYSLSHGVPQVDVAAAQGNIVAAAPAAMRALRDILSAAATLGLQGRSASLDRALIDAENAINHAKGVFE